MNVYVTVECTGKMYLIEFNDFETLTKIYFCSSISF